VAIRFTPRKTDPNRKFDLTSLDARTGHLSTAHSITSSARTRSDCGTPLDVQLEDLNRFAKEVIPAFRDTRTAAAAQ
jgi:hypothetical protein